MKLTRTSYGFDFVKSADDNQHFLRVEVNDLSPEEVAEGQRVGADVEGGKTQLWHIAVDEGFKLANARAHEELEAAYQRMKKEMLQ